LKKLFAIVFPYKRCSDPWPIGQDGVENHDWAYWTPVKVGN